MSARTTQPLCGSQKKKMYRSRNEAIRAALSYSKRRGTPLRVYWHVQCRSYHLTHKRKWD